MSVTDELAKKLAKYLAPLLRDDDWLDGTLYPAGAAFEYYESAAAGGNLREYLVGFTNALGIDHELWTTFQAQVGPENAQWRLNEGPTRKS